MTSQQQLTASDIREFYKNNPQAIRGQNGGFTLGNASQAASSIGRTVHDLGYESLQAALVGTLTSSLFPGPWVIPTQDFALITTWAAQVAMNASSNIFSVEYYEIKTLIGNATLAAWANKRPIAQANLHHYDRLLIEHSDSFFAYLCFPLLESTLRLANKNYVSNDGLVISDFTVNHASGHQTSYKANGSKRCNSLRDMLKLYHSTCSPSNKKDIEDCLSCIVDGDTDSAIEQIYDWRNGCMHGSRITQLAGFSSLGLSLVVLMHLMEAEFEATRLRALKDTEYLKANKPHPDNYFYPPF